MSSDIVVLTQFCDDIRQEVGNKISLIGCYSDELIIADPFPTLLSKLCAQTRVLIPFEKRTTSLKVVAFLNEEPIAQVEVSPATLEAAFSKGHELGVAKRIVVIAFLTFSPMVVPEESQMRIDIQTDFGSVHGNTLTFRTLAKQSDASDAPGHTPH